MNATLPPVLETKLADFRRHVWVVKLSEAVLADAGFPDGVPFERTWLEVSSEFPATLKRAIECANPLTTRSSQVRINAEL